MEEILVPMENQFAAYIVKECNVLILREELLSQVSLLVFDGKKYTKDENELTVRAKVQEICNKMLVNAWSELENTKKSSVDEVRYENGDIEIIPRARKQRTKKQQQIFHWNGFVYTSNFVEKLQNNPGYCLRLADFIVDNIKLRSELIVHETDFDTDPFVLNTPTGILDLRNCMITPHDPKYLVMNITNANYIPNVTDNDSPKAYLSMLRDAIWDDNLSIEENENVLDSLLSVYSYSLIGGNPEKIIHVIVGPTNSGKSVELLVRSKALGSYAASIHAKSLMKTNRSKSDIRPDIVRTRNARIITAVETDENDTFDSATLKTLSGNDEQNYRNPHRATGTFKMKGKIAIATNYFPKFSDVNDIALINRLVITELRNTVPEDKQNKDLSNELTRQEMLDRIFTLLCIKAQEYIERGEIVIHETFVSSKRRIVLSQCDSVRQFWKDCVFEIPYQMGNGQFNLYVREWYYCYTQYTAKNGMSPCSLTSFGIKFREITDSMLFVTRDDDRSGIFYKGIIPSASYLSEIAALRMWK